MKSKILTLFSICLLFFLLLHPDEGLLGARDGLTLWLNVMLPTLLPFLIFTGILLKSGNLTKLLNPFSLLWKKCFGLSPAGAYVLILGFLCGYPMGAKIAHDLYRIHPMQIVLILLTADLFCMLFFRFLIYHGNTLTPAKVKSIKKETYQQDSTGVILDVSIMNGFETITRLGGYILIFSLVFTCIRHYWPFSEQTSILFTSPIELTTGLQQIAHSRYSWRFRCISSITLTAFGGLCVMFQTKSVLENRLSLFPYVTSKCLNTSLVFLFLVLSDIV